MVFEATYLVAVLTAGHMSLCCGQNGAQMSKVFRPINKSNGMFICFFMAAEETGSECGLVHPPYLKPVLVSSSGPPGACMTPSRETNSSTLIFLMTEFLSSSIRFFFIYGCRRFSMSQVEPLGSREADPARGTPTPVCQAGIGGSVVTAAQLLCWVLRHREESVKAFLTTPRTIERTSTGTRQARAPLRAHASASSKLAAFRIVKPPTCSLVSRR